MESEYFWPLMMVARVYFIAVDCCLFSMVSYEQSLPSSSFTLLEVCRIRW
jgi:hypothetical protein